MKQHHNLKLRCHSFIGSRSILISMFFLMLLSCQADHAPDSEKIKLSQNDSSSTEDEQLPSEKPYELEPSRSIPDRSSPDITDEEENLAIILAEDNSAVNTRTNTTIGATTVLDAGTVPLSPLGRSSRLAFVVTPEIESVTLVAVADSSFLNLQIDRIRTPQQKTITQGNNMYQHLNRSSEVFGVQAVLIPQSPDNDNILALSSGQKSGKLTFDVVATDVFTGEAPIDEHLVHIYVMSKTKSQSPASRDDMAFLDINFFLTGAAGITKSNAMTSKRLQNAIAQMRHIYEQAKIEIRHVSYYDIDKSYHDIRGSVPGDMEGGKSLAELQKQSKIASKPGLNFYLVESLILDPDVDNGYILGIAGGIPGPALLNNTDRSGVVVLYNSNDIEDDDELGSTMAHEGGHFLGLFHNVESKRSLKDNLSDTPASGNAARTNLMYWSTSPLGQNVLTPMQNKTMRRSPLIY